MKSESNRGVVINAFRDELEKISMSTSAKALMGGVGVTVPAAALAAGLGMSKRKKQGKPLVGGLVGKSLHGKF